MTTLLSSSAPDWVIVLVIILTLWSIPWKGIALWKASRLSHKWWFIAILVLNTFAIVEIIYIFFVANKFKVQSEETKS